MKTDKKYEIYIDQLEKKRDLDNLELLLSSISDELVNILDGSEKSDKDITKLTNRIQKLVLSINKVKKELDKKDTTIMDNEIDKNQKKLQQYSTIYNKNKAMLDIASKIWTNADPKILMDDIWDIVPTLCSCMSSVVYNVVEEKWVKYISPRIEISNDICTQNKGSTLLPILQGTIEWNCVLEGVEQFHNNIEHVSVNKTINQLVWQIHNTIITPIKILITKLKKNK